MTTEFLLLLAIGFVAQLIDGALGMAYGVLSNAAMLAIGLPPAHASALVHTAEIFTTGASAASHIYHRNVDWRLVMRLGVAGVLGAVLGAWVLSNVDAVAARRFVYAYLLLMGVYILYRSIESCRAASGAGALDLAARSGRRISRRQRRWRMGSGGHLDADRLGSRAAPDGRFGQRHGILRGRRGGDHVLHRAWGVAAAAPAATGAGRPDRGAARRVGGQARAGVSR